MDLKACVAICVAVAAVAAIAVPPAEAAAKKRVVTHTTRQVAGVPRSRITVQRRSFLDAGTEVLPGERKFTDYAFPPGYSPTAVIDNHAGHHRSPLPGAFDLPSRYNPYPWNWCPGC